MPGLYSFHKEENKKTREMISLIQQYPFVSTNVDEERVHLLTLIWALVKDENYYALVACKTSAQIKRLLQSEVVKLLRGKGHSIALNPSNYNRFKSELNAFYKYLLGLSSYYVQHRIWMNQEKIRKELKTKDASLPILLRQEQLAFRLQRLAALPKIQVKGSYETDRVEMNFEDKKMLDEFIAFLTKDVSETKQALDHVKRKAGDFGNFVRRRKEISLAFLFLTLFTLNLSTPAPEFFAHLFAPTRHMDEMRWLSVSQNRTQANHVDLRNRTNEPLEIMSVTLVAGNHKKSLAAGLVLAPGEMRTLLLDGMPRGTSRLDIGLRNPAGKERVESWTLPLPGF